MSAPRHFRRPLFNLGKNRDRAEWMDRFARFAARAGPGKRGKPRRGDNGRDDDEDKLPPGSGMPSDPPPPPAPGLSGGAAAPLEYRD